MDIFSCLTFEYNKTLKNDFSYLVGMFLKGVTDDFGERHFLIKLSRIKLRDIRSYCFSILDLFTNREAGIKFGKIFQNKIMQKQSFFHSCVRGSVNSASRRFIYFVST